MTEFDIRKSAKRGLVQLLSKEADHERVADMILQKLSNNITWEDIQLGRKKKAIIPFMVVFEHTPTKSKDLAQVTICVHHCLESGEIASHWLRDQIIKKLNLEEIPHDK